jgi:ferritin
MEQTLLDKITKSDEKPSLSCKLVQKQIEHELENERLYLSMASWCDHYGLTETAKFFYEHSLEERKHAMDFANHALARGKRAIFGATKEMKQDFTDCGELLEEALLREKETTKLILELYRTGLKEGTLAVNIASKYIDEQKEEEQLFLSLLNLWKTCNGSKIDFEMEVMKLKCKDKIHLKGNL